ncbi:hypothetical protein [Sinorhizobium meliloti]|uniref:hypothetical protein n=1 Tax=Rhizobium meliloti TaxID=382 RepID=UPI0001E4CDAD|nr:hypothetical protein [Sinorhizobium meliloti]AEG52561.1 hypothetical protein Sinme_0803 [Sinorhizobium meliloti AK83]ASP77420.1 hypothetical protein CDO27_05230 [Sinorhizobium meliloti]MDE4591722.1 hypothetical protein [Sinorhizobium meliloti]MQW16835.1 hypothetical protein [Sinorhizobium meliloti]QND27145.1 hypothetical protein HB773_12295 [Sinorhizobium meliloti]
MEDKDKRSDLHRAKLGMAMVSACLVQTLNETDPTFQQRFLKRMEAAYREMKDNTGGDVKEQLEALSWTMELLTGWDPIGGRQEPFLADYEP